jgi:hypothetical protein
MTKNKDFILYEFLTYIFQQSTIMDHTTHNYINYSKKKILIFKLPVNDNP